MIIQADFFIEISLIGLGLLLALYTLVIGKIEDFREENHNKKNTVSQIRILIEKESDTSVKKELNILVDNLDKTQKGSGYEYDWGYFVSGIFFVLSLLIGFLTYLWSNITLLKLGMICALLGILNFCFVWFKTMIAFRRILKGKLEIKTNN